MLALFVKTGHLSLHRRVTAYYLLFGVAAVACLAIGFPALIRSLNSHRREQFTPVFGAHATYEDPLTNGPRSGPTLVYYWAIVLQAFPSLRYEITRVHDTDQIMVVEWVLHGVGAGTSPPPINGVFVIEFNGDAIGAVRAYFDARPFGIRALSPTPTVPAS